MCYISVIIVNTNTRQVTCQCLESLYTNAPKCDFEVIVVDNASTDGSCEAIELSYPQVRLVRNLQNVGFCVANNRGLEISRGKHKLLLNNDTIVLAESLDLLLFALNRDSRVGIVAPKLLYPDGSLQMSFGPMPSLFVSFCSFFEIKKWIPYNLIAGLGQVAGKRVLGKNAASYIKWFSSEGPKTTKLESHVLVTGACMLIRDECFRQVGMLDPVFFMYVDDADYCKRVYDAGWEIQYVAESTIVHIKGGTVGERYRWTSPEAYHSVFHFLEKHRGKGVARMVKLIALLSLLFRSLKSTLFARPTVADDWKLLKAVATREG